MADEKGQEKGDLAEVNNTQVNRSKIGGVFYLPFTSNNVRIDFFRRFIMEEVMALSLMNKKHLRGILHLTLSTVPPNFKRQSEFNMLKYTRI